MRGGSPYEMVYSGAIKVNILTPIVPGGQERTKSHEGAESPLLKEGMQGSDTVRPLPGLELPGLPIGCT